MIGALLGDLLPYLVAALVALGGLWGYGRSKKRQGAAENAREAEIEDAEHAESIRNRVRDDRVKRMRELEGRGYRD